MAVIQEAATTGFSNAQAYDAHRPSYPTDAVEGLLAHLGVSGKPQSKIIDLAAGTGKFTELLAQRDEQYDILAVEPHEAMRQTLVNKNLRGVKVREGTAEQMDVPDGWADAVVVAQAFHWFSNIPALKEIRRVLKLGGKLAVIWNIENYNKPQSWPAETQWEEAMNALIHSLPADGALRFRQYVWPDVFDQQGEKPFFTTPLNQDSLSWTVRLTTNALWDRINTLSQPAILQGADKEAFRAKFAEILKGGDCDWNDAGEVLMHGMTHYAWTTRL